ncbi:M20 metallopeptidase family protein [Coprobacter tertius]|uniref:M20 family metallopeptidase n=1 Tax=Coprobacter tertius TaxID=2944915 RepID=A0ABT1MG74_9BACT|nr:M20 family metallopeptidase [Coprobacter tertius]MCP9611638.1 M20 family metallopeptidase [Coprobacter tertius]
MKGIVKELVRQTQQKVSEIYRHLHMYPELSFEEKETSAYITQILVDAGVPFRKNIGGYGIMARIEGKEKGRIIGLRADMDALFIQEANDIPFRSVNQHIMHACGHDAHTACLAGTTLILNQLRDKFDGIVLPIFQPGEEKHPGGARLMLEDGIFNEIKPELMIAQHTNMEIDSGKVTFGEGCVMASADEIHIVVKGKGGHGAMPHRINDTVLAASEIVVAVQQIVSRRRNPFIPAVITFGRLIADGATNIIPDKVTLAGTFRCMDNNERKRLKPLIRETIQHTAKACGCECEISIPEGYPAVTNDAFVTRKAANYAREILGSENVGEMERRMTSEDFGFFAETIPSTFYRLGVKGKNNPQCGEQHTDRFLIDESALITGVETFTYLALRFLQDKY